MIKINISIEADSVEEAKTALAELGSSAAVSSEPVATSPSTEVSAPVEKPTTRTRKATAAEPTKPEATVVPLNAPAGDPLGAAAPAADPLAATGTAPAGDPLGSTAPSAADPLGASAPAANPLASAPAATTPPTTPPAQTGTIGLQEIRAKIGLIGSEKKQACKDLIATYKKADGTPCDKPSDLQESDYASVYDDLDYV